MSLRAILIGQHVTGRCYATRKPHIIKFRGYWQVYNLDKPTWQMPTFGELGKYWDRFT